MNAMYEVEPWPGVLFRTVNNNSQFEFDANGGSAKFNKRYNVVDTNKVTIKRRNGILYFGVNDVYTTGPNHSSITTFDVPVTFGASLNASGSPQRYYKGTLKNMKVVLYE